MNAKTFLLCLIVWEESFDKVGRGKVYRKGENNERHAVKSNYSRQ